MKALDLNGLKKLYNTIHAEIVNYFTKCNDELDAALDIIADAYTTKDELNSAISGLISFDTCIVDSLPTTGTKGIIYLYKSKNNTSASYYDEYIWIESSNKFEMIGTTEINANDTVTTDQMNTAISEAVATANSYADEKATTIQDLTNSIIYTRTVNKFNVRLCKFGNIVIFYADITTNASNEYKFKLGTLPEIVRPVVNTSQNILDNNGNFCFFYCDANGDFGFRYSSYKSGTVGIRHTMFFVTE